MSYHQPEITVSIKKRIDIIRKYEWTCPACNTKQSETHMNEEPNILRCLNTTAQCFAEIHCINDRWELINEK